MPTSSTTPLASLCSLRSTMSAVADLHQIRLITFRIGPETFVLDIMAVRQIIPYSGSTTVPTAPEFIEGVIVLRNEVVPVIDLRTRLYPTLPERSEAPLVFIMMSDEGVIGLKVDEVRRIVTVSRDELLPPPPLIHGIRGDLLIGVVPHGEEVYRARNEFVNASWFTSPSPEEIKGRIRAVNLGVAVCAGRVMVSLVVNRPHVPTPRSEMPLCWFVNGTGGKGCSDC